MAAHWVVWEWKTGTAWRCDPPTAANARREAELAGRGHEAMLLIQTPPLQRAFANGRMYGHKQAREQAKAH